jgi:hypothetical protein
MNFFFWRQINIIVLNCIVAFRWFRRDDNAIPPVFLLQPISSLLPDYASAHKESRAQAASQWWNELDVMQEAIGQAAVTCFTPEHVHALIQSGLLLK